MSAANGAENTLEAIRNAERASDEALKKAREEATEIVSRAHREAEELIAARADQAKAKAKATLGKAGIDADRILSSVEKGSGQGSGELKAGFAARKPDAVRLIVDSIV
ncbi:MAG: hypothetical protein K5985_00060 [Lachnospiraceae bacterium]|nr:hypothetical protein [Lachnospiraceae bacterium]